MVVAYRVHPLTGWLARRLIRVQYVCLVNLVLGRPAVPELLAGECRPDRLAAALARLLASPAARAAQRRDLAAATARLRHPEGPAAERAARIILALAGAAAEAREDSKGEGS